MPDSVKMLIAEINGNNLEFHEEHDFTPENMPFDDPFFSADNVKDAITELRQALSPLVVTIPLTHNGTLTNGDYIGYNNLLSNKKIIIPITGTFTGYTMSNSKSDADFALEFKLISEETPPFLTRSTDNVESENFDLAVPQPVTAGGALFIKYVDEGTNASDMSIVLKFKA